MTSVDRDIETCLNEYLIVTNPFVWPQRIQMELIISFVKSIGESGTNQNHMHPLHVMRDLNVHWQFHGYVVSVSVTYFESSLSSPLPQPRGAPIENRLFSSAALLSHAELVYVIF
jgi:hypothetical protein